ncbi:hypothetical protein GQ56_0130620 [Burkholderia paludis]|nr:hypothetical protein GQ56_0130620 [Burkholderia paludis]
MRGARSNRCYRSSDGRRERGCLPGATCLGDEEDAAILSGKRLAAFIGDARRTVESMLST